MSHAITQGIEVRVAAHYSPERSDPSGKAYFFVYQITIQNVGTQSSQLQSRHWIITDANEHVEEVRGPGVVGQFPLLKPGEMFSYTSGCQLRTQFGTMRGSYLFAREDGTVFEAEIAPFVLAVPAAVN